MTGSFREPEVFMKVVEILRKGCNVHSIYGNNTVHTLCGMNTVAVWQRFFLLFIIFTKGGSYATFTFIILGRLTCSMEFLEGCNLKCYKFRMMLQIHLVIDFCGKV
ncbi:hypothetical protein CsSME_00019545 [Camellia sinensis var. sinensis]